MTTYYQARRNASGDAFVSRRDSEIGGGALPLPNRQDLARFHYWMDWTFPSMAPQLALSLLADATGDGRLALELCQRYAQEVLAVLDEQGWMIEAEEVRRWCAVQESCAGARERFGGVALAVLATTAAGLAGEGR